MKKWTAIAAAFFALFFVLATVCWAGNDMKTQTINGVVSDSNCGAKPGHTAECTKGCVGHGAKLVVVTDSDQKVLMVDNQDALKGHEGHHVAVTGEVNGDSIHIESVKML